MIPFARRKRRNRDFRRRRAVPVPPPPPALSVVAVDGIAVVGADLEMNVIFDVTPENPLADVSGAEANKWSARYQGTRYAGGIVAGILFDTLFLQLTAVGPESGADELSYANAPSDIADTLGRQLAAFSGFAL